MAARTLARVTTPRRLPSRAAAARLARRVDAGEPALGRARRVGRMLRELAETHPDAHCELDFTTPLELAVATILSAQSTDKRVNAVTPDALRPLPHGGRLRQGRPRRAGGDDPARPASSATRPTR